MLAAGVCIVALILTRWMASRSLWSGLLTCIGVGYFYGIIRANLLSAAAHFVFDCSLLALYSSTLIGASNSVHRRSTVAIRGWLTVLIGWPVLLLFLPFQPFLVSLVGLRGNIFFLPVLYLGSMLSSNDVRKLTFGFACLNLVALTFAIAEFVLGVPRFFPPSAVTSIIYASSDAGSGFHRIPATFSNAHSYAGAMLGTMPWLLCAWGQTSRRVVEQVIIAAGLFAAIMGILFASTRTAFVLAAVLVVVSLFLGKMSTGKRLVWAAVIVLAGLAAVTQDRFSRFRRLDADTVTDRIGGSVNRNFLEILYEYPMGNGLGGGGTSLPYFLQGLVRNPVGLENEYSRILLEQGVIGLGVWLAFFAWTLSRREFLHRYEWRSARVLLFLLHAVGVAGSCLGIGMLTSIPGTVFNLMALGWLLTRPPECSVRPTPRAEFAGAVSV